MRLEAPVLATVLFAAACSTPVADVGGLSNASDTTAAPEQTTGSAESETSGATTTGGGGGPATTDVADSSSSSDATTDGLPLFDLGSAETGAVSECADEAPDVLYVLTNENFQGFSDGAHGIWSFDPTTLEYTHEVDILCPEILGQMTGLTVFRDGTYGLLSWEPSLVGAPMQLSRMNAAGDSCEVLFQAPFDNSLCDLAVVADEESGDEELFVHSCTGGGFAMSDGSHDLGWLWRVDDVEDAAAFTVIDGDPYSSMPLAGTGDGRLFGVSGSQESPDSIRLIEFDVTTGARTETLTPGLSIGDAGHYFAMGFYGGDFYTFGLETGDADVLDIHTVVHRYDWDDDDGNGVHEVTELPYADPLRIIAAASPTCIPLTPAG